MQSAFVLQHEHDDDIKLIGIYRTRELAEAAIARLKGQPGFRDCPAGFSMDEYLLDKDHWAEGYISCSQAMVNKEN